MRMLDRIALWLGLVVFIALFVAMTIGHAPP